MSSQGRVQLQNGLFIEPSVPLTALIPDDKNPNQMPEAVYRQLVENIKNPKIGFAQPILVRPEMDANGQETGRFFIVDGHHRALAAREAGMVAVPAIGHPSMSQEYARVVGVAMNNLHGNLDLGAVGELFRDLSMNFAFTTNDLIVTGFDAGVITKLLEFKVESPDMPAAPGPETPNQGAKIHELSVAFAEKKDLDKVKRAIKKAKKALNVADNGIALLHLLSLRDA